MRAADILKKLFIKIKFKSGNVFYIHGSDTLPPPLTKEEEQKVFDMMDTDFEKARESLIVHNLRLVVYIAKKFEGTGVGLEDLDRKSTRLNSSHIH